MQQRVTAVKATRYERLDSVGSFYNKWPNSSLISHDTKKVIIAIAFPFFCSIPLSWDGWNEFLKPKIFRRFWVFQFAVPDICWRFENPTRHTFQCTLSIGTIWFAVKCFLTNKSPGVDMLHPRVLFETRDMIDYPLYLIYSKSLELGILPSDWKLGEVTAIYKKDLNRTEETFLCPI